MKKRIPKISHKKEKKLAKQGKLRDQIELWVDLHNHKMELIRTVTSIVSLMVSTVVLLRVFGIL